jgi:hypothetical protein
MHVNTHLFGVFCCALGLLGVFFEMRARKKRNEKLPRSFKVYAIGATIGALCFGLLYLFDIK